MSLLNQNNIKIKVACSDSESHPELCGVFLTPSETCATNSFYLIKCSTIKGLTADYPKLPNGTKPLENWKPFILPKNKAEEVLKIFYKPNKNLPVLSYASVLKSNGTEAEIATTDLEGYRSVTSRVTDGRFPDYQQLFNEDGGYAEIKVNAEYLKEIAGYFSSFGNKTKEVSIKFPLKPSKAIKFLSENGYQKAEALLMVMKSI